MPKRSMFYGSTPGTFRKANMLRRNETEAESLLWARLRKNQVKGFRFKRQHPVADYVADFYCHQARLVIEIDEAHHSNRQQVLHDHIRTDTMVALGLTVLRFREKEILDNVDNVIHEIEERLTRSS